MKKIAIAALLIALLMGIDESDCGAFVVYALLFAPIFIQKKGSVENGKKRRAI